MVLQGVSTSDWIPLSGLSLWLGMDARVAPPVGIPIASLLHFLQCFGKTVHSYPGIQENEAHAVARVASLKSRDCGTPTSAPGRGDLKLTKTQHRCSHDLLDNFNRIVYVEGGLYRGRGEGPF